VLTDSRRRTFNTESRKDIAGPLATDFPQACVVHHSTHASLRTGHTSQPRSPPGIGLTAMTPFAVPIRFQAGASTRMDSALIQIMRRRRVTQRRTQHALPLTSCVVSHDTRRGVEAIAIVLEPRTYSRTSRAAEGLPISSASRMRPQCCARHLKAGWLRFP
jgi:hypothetical protein